MEIIMMILGLSSINCLIISTNWYSETIFDRKPFNCALCSGFWYSLPIYLSLYGLQGIPYAAITGIVAELLDSKINFR